MKPADPLAGNGSVPIISNCASPWSKERQFKRFRVDLKVELYRTGEQRPRRGRSSDLSEGGLGGIMVADMPVGETLTLEFVGAPLLRPVKVQAVVRNRVGFRYGFEFLALSREQRALIHAATLFLPTVAA
jgi:hypothetical protein